MRALLVINARVDGGGEGAVHNGHSPRKDYAELQRALGADVIDLGSVEKRASSYLAQRLLGSSVAQALLAVTVAGRYEAVFVDRESTGFLLAALCRLQRKRPRLVVLGHLLSPRKKQIIFRLLRLRTSVDCVVVHSSLQQVIARDALGLLPDQVAFIPYHSDVQFWVPSDVSLKRQICSVGLEYRDHRTLMKAVRNLDIDVVIAAASHWSKHQSLDGADIPSNVRVAAFDYQALRQLYAESLFVVVPLLDIDNQAGITTILEAMAMGKAVVVSHSRGQIDVVRDRRRQSRFIPGRPTQPDWARRLGADESIAEGQTGIYVKPGDAAELRRVITFLLDHPDEARRMGANARRLVEATMSLDHYTARLAATVRGERVDGSSAPPIHGSAVTESAGAIR